VECSYQQSKFGVVTDGIVSADGMLWYPKVWPSLEDRLEAQLDILAEQKLESAKSMVQAEIIEMFAPKVATAPERYYESSVHCCWD
jgi:hypothetical protein